VKYDLHPTFQACQTYWKEKGDDKSCNLEIVSQEKYGFVPSKYVSITGKGTAANFTASAQYQDSPKVFSIDAQGTITKKK